MKKIVCLVAFFFVCWQAYPFWIWSPKTQEWKNPKYSPLATPRLQYDSAFELFEKGDFQAAYAEFRKLLINYPDAREAAEAQYYLGRCLEEIGKPFEAFLAYKTIVQSYPNSERIAEAIERSFNIGEYFLEREAPTFLGISFYDFVEHPAVRIFKSIVEVAPYSDYASRSQYQLGIIYLELSRFEQARSAFQKVIDDYPQSRWAAPAKYQLALATAKVFSGTDYDATHLSSASEKLDQFIRDHPEAQISQEARQNLIKLRVKEAQKIFETGEFYLRRRRPESAVIYFQRVVDNFPDTQYYQKAKEQLASLRPD